MTTMPSTFNIFRVFIAANFQRFATVGAILLFVSLSLILSAVVIDKPQSTSLLLMLVAICIQVANTVLFALVASMKMNTANYEIEKHGYNQGIVTFGLKSPVFFAPELTYDELAKIGEELNANPIY